MGEEENKVQRNTSYLGTGWGFPPTFSRITGSVEMTSDEMDIEQSLGILLSTSIGERILQPKYGCNLHDLLFEPLNTTMKTYIKGHIEQAILMFEPRILLNEIEIDYDNELEGKVDILLVYTIRTTNSRYNMVYPFYRSEGSNIQA